MFSIAFELFFETSVLNSIKKEQKIIDNLSWKMQSGNTEFSIGKGYGKGWLETWQAK